MRKVKRINWGVILLLTVAAANVWVDLMILYRIRNIDNPKEVHIMMPQMNSSAVEVSQ